MFIPKMFSHKIMHDEARWTTQINNVKDSTPDFLNYKTCAYEDR